jgi:proteic killer suppression protein
MIPIGSITIIFPFVGITALAVTRPGGSSGGRVVPLVGSRYLSHSDSFYLRLDLYKQIVYIEFMISSFANKETEKLFTTGKSKKLPPEIITRSILRLTQLDCASEVTDLLLPPSNRLETLSGDRAGQWSVRINDQWRICFRFVNGEATDVEITDYH